MNNESLGNGPEVEAWSALASLEAEVRKEIGSFSVNRLSQAARWLERTDDLHKRRDSVNQDACERVREGKALLSPVPLLDHRRFEIEPSSHSEVASASSALRGGKARGRECRAAYVAQQARQEKPLARVRGALYRNGNGLVVGIPYAKVRKNEWFLGLPAGQFKAAALLCEAIDAKVQPIHLTESFLNEYGKRLSVSSQYNQTKFNVRFRAGRYYLVVNGIGDVDLTDSLGEVFACPQIA